MSVVGWLRRAMRCNVEEENDMPNACNGDCKGIDNGDGLDQCIVWSCWEYRVRFVRVAGGWRAVTSLHCEAHQGFANVEQD